MKLRPLLIAPALVALAVPTLVAASSSAKAPKDYASIALNVLPPGEAADSSANSTDQLALYDALTPLWNAVSPSNVHRLFKPETFGLQGEAAGRGHRPEGTEDRPGQVGCRAHNGQDPRGRHVRIGFRDS